MDQIWLVLVSIVVVALLVVLFIFFVGRRPRRHSAIDSSDNAPIRMSTDGVDGNPTLSNQSRFARERDAIAKAEVGNKMLYYGRYRNF